MRKVGYLVVPCVPMLSMVTRRAELESSAASPRGMVSFVIPSLH
jgi:hypothetical protein